MTNVVYLMVLPLPDIQHARRIAWRRRSSSIFPPMVVLMAVAIMISTFGCVNSLVLSDARLLHKGPALFAAPGH
jgi:APA family basic amino acid/polyamine antiporter